MTRIPQDGDVWFKGRTYITVQAVIDDEVIACSDDGDTYELRWPDGLDGWELYYRGDAGAEL